MPRVTIHTVRVSRNVSPSPGRAFARTDPSESLPIASFSPEVVDAIYRVGQTAGQDQEECRSNWLSESWTRRFLVHALTVPSFRHCSFGDCYARPGTLLAEPRDLLSPPHPLAAAGIPE